jgi:hypothetical protein
MAMQNLRDSDEDEMVAAFLEGELFSERFGPAVRDALLAGGQADELVTHPISASGETMSSDERCLGPRADRVRTARCSRSSRVCAEYGHACPPANWHGSATWSTPTGMS